MNQDQFRNDKTHNSEESKEGGKLPLKLAALPIGPAIDSSKQACKETPTALIAYDEVQNALVYCKGGAWVKLPLPSLMKAMITAPKLKPKVDASKPQPRGNQTAKLTVQKKAKLVEIKNKTKPKEVRRPKKKDDSFYCRPSLELNGTTMCFKNKDH